MDVAMPIVDGYTGCRRFRSDSSLTNIPIIMVTAFDRLNDVERAFEADARDYIIKPIQAEILKKKLNKALSTQSPTPP